ncbi:hypothetical protein D1614_25200, partial [Maribellus luteus]
AIFALLFLALGGVRRAAAVFATAPLCLAGGVFALALTGIAFSVSAAVGFICLSGVAVLNGLVVMSSIGKRLEDGADLAAAIVEGAYERVRPVIMTGLVPAVGFVPMALASGTGAEVQKPLAVVVIGGLIGAQGDQTYDRQMYGALAGVQVEPGFEIQFGAGVTDQSDRGT